jgi:hypothetical protein
MNEERDARPHAPYDVPCDGSTNDVSHDALRGASYGDARNDDAPDEALQIRVPVPKKLRPSSTIPIGIKGFFSCLFF